MTIRTIWAQSRSGAIGDSGGMLWHLPEDMAFFRRATTGLPVVMGRRTWESFPDAFRPLPDRSNIVITHDTAYHAPGARVVSSLPDALAAAAAEDDEVWVIGGAQIYRQAMDVADELWVTEIDVDAEGDAYAPEITHEWHPVRTEPAESDAWLTGRNGTRYRFVVYRRAADA